jgi:hypothetical protein
LTNDHCTCFYVHLFIGYTKEVAQLPTKIIFKKYLKKKGKKEEDNIVAKGALHTLLHSVDRTRPSMVIWAFLKGNSFKYVKYMALELK